MIQVVGNSEISLSLSLSAHASFNVCRTIVCPKRKRKSFVLSHWRKPSSFPIHNSRRWSYMYAKNTLAHMWWAGAITDLLCDEIDNRVSLVSIGVVASLELFVDSHGIRQNYIWQSAIISIPSRSAAIGTNWPTIGLYNLRVIYS